MNRAQRRGCNVTSSLPRSQRAHDPMAAYDRLPADLRAWLRHALLPWSAHSARRIWLRLLRDCGGDVGLAQARLSLLEQRHITQDARRIWGADHPAAGAAAGTSQAERAFAP